MWEEEEAEAKAEEEMTCTRCGTAKALKGKELCGICEIAVAQKFPGVQTASLVPQHFNLGLGEYVEDYDDLKGKREKARREGLISGWE